MFNDVKHTKNGFTSDLLLVVNKQIRHHLDDVTEHGLTIRR